MIEAVEKGSCSRSRKESHVWLATRRDNQTNNGNNAKTTATGSVEL